MYRVDYLDLCQRRDRGLISDLLCYFFFYYFFFFWGENPWVLLPPYYVGLSGFAVGSGLGSVNKFYFYFLFLFFQILVQNFFLSFFFFLA